MTIQDLDGLLLESKYAEPALIVKGPIVTNWQDGLPRQEPKHFVFQFDRYICDVGEECRRMELTDEDKEFVARKFTTDLQNPDIRADYWVHEPPVAAPPWPNYENTHAQAIPGIAKQIGMVMEAIAYEERRDGGPRESVVRKLQESQEQQATEDDFVAV